MSQGPHQPDAGGSSRPDRAARGPASSRRRPLIITAIIVIALIIAFVAATQVYTEVLWYDQVGYLTVFLRENGIKVGVFLAAAVLMAFVVWLSMRLAWRHRPARPAAGRSRAGRDAAREQARRDHEARYGRAGNDTW